MFKNLVHIFREPSSEHERRHQLSRMTETAAARGGSPTGALLFLYDELIEAVEGYSVAGAPVPAQRIAAEMDAMHKLVALERLFNPSDARLVARDGEWFASRFLRQCRSGRR